MLSLEVNSAKKVISRIISYDNRLVNRKCHFAGSVLDKVDELACQCNNFEQMKHLFNIANRKLGEQESDGMDIPPEAFTCINDCQSEVTKIEARYLERKRRSMERLSSMALNVA